MMKGSFLTFGVFLLAVNFQASSAWPYSGLRSTHRHQQEDENIIKVTTIEMEPYVMVRNAGSRGNARFSGFIPDLLSEISKVAKFNYSLHLVSDGRYGICSETSCNGMIGEVLSEHADLSAAAMTMTAEREKFIDFTHPVDVLGITTLYKTPLPFTSLSAMVEMAERGEITLGSITGGATERFFMESANPLYRRIAELLSASNANSNTYSEGVERVQQGNHAFFMESQSAEFYIAQQPDCSLTTFGSLLQTRFYAFATRTASPLRERINRALLRLQWSGKVDEIAARYWTKQCGL